MVFLELEIESSARGSDDVVGLVVQGRALERELSDAAVKADRI